MAGDKNPNEDVGAVFPVINDARKAVPSVNYAMGLAGIAAATSLIVIFIGNKTSGYILFAITFIGMVLLFIFSRLIKSKSSATYFASLFLMWSILIFFVSFLIMTISVFITGKPRTWGEIIGIQISEISSLSKEQRENQIILANWMCQEVKANFDLDSALSRLHFDSFVVKEIEKDPAKPQWEGIMGEGKFFQIEYRFAFNEEDKDDYGHTLYVYEKDSSKYQIINDRFKQKVFLELFGTPSESNSGYVVEGEDYLFGQQDSPLIEVKSYLMMPVVSVEWWNNDSAWGFQKLCKDVPVDALS
jgi:hypothetical protein